jgi:hypothetical protein
MQWATRRNMRVDRLACVWLIRRFIDSSAEIAFVDDTEIASLTHAGVGTFDAKDAKYTHSLDESGGKYGEHCSFQTLLDEFKLNTLPPLARMGRILWAADIAHHLEIFEPKEGIGLWALAQGYSLMLPDDYEKMGVALSMFDALHAYCEAIENGRLQLPSYL